MGPVKLPFADHDLAPLVKRYSSSTIVTMLREIAKCKTSKLNWAMLCKGTSTGITNPKEYQALWRGIAYRAELDDSYDDNNDSPLEDDSDLDVDLDPVPPVRSAVADSISSFVKSDLQQQELEEARVEQNPVQTGVGHRAADLSTARLQQGSGLLGKPDGSAGASRLPCLASATQCAAITEVESTAVTSTKVPYSGAVNQADRKRRRLWTPDEDLALISAVDECGEGNWTTVLKNHCDFDRSASQLSQRWALIRKRREVQEKAGYGIGSGVSPLASGYKDLRPEGLKSSVPAGIGTLKDVGKIAKQPLASPASIPASKRAPVSSVSTGTETAVSVLETQRVNPKPASSGVSSSWQKAHGQAAMRAGALQGHKGAMPEGVRRPVQGPPIGSQGFYANSQTSTAGVDSKYAASRNMGAGMGAGVGRGGGGSKSVHGPDPMIQAAAMAAGARIAPASAAASLLKAAQSGNVVHIGSGGLPRSKLGLTSQAGNGNAGGNPGIVHYIRTGSGGTMATTSTNLQRTSSHHMAKNQTNNRSFGSNVGSGNSSPLSNPSVVPAQGSRNNPQAAVQSSKPASLSKRGSSPQQQKHAPNSASLTPSSNPASTPSNPASTTPPTVLSAAPAPSSSSASPPKFSSASTPSSTPTSTVAPRSASTTPPSSSTSAAAAALSSTSTPAPALKSTSVSIPSLPFKSTPLSFPSSAAKSAPAATSITTSASAPSAASGSAPVLATVSARGSAPASARALAPVSAPVSARALAPVSAPASARASASASSVLTPASASISTSASTPVSALSTPVSVPVAAPVSASISTSVSAPGSAPVSAPGPAAVSTSVSAPVSAPVSASILTSVSVPVVAYILTPVSAPVSTPALAPVSAPASAPVSAPASAPVSIPACGFNTAGSAVDSPGEGTL